MLLVLSMVIYAGCTNKNQGSNEEPKLMMELLQKLQMKQMKKN